MLVGCPKCKTRYRIDDDRVGAEGIKLRCSKCQTVFRILRKAASPPPPAAAEPLPAPAVAPAPAPAPERAASPSGDRKIRVVVGHESEAFCSAVRGVLAAEPIDVTVCHDGEAALAAARESSPDLVLLDVALPKMFGFEVCEAIKNDPAISGVKVILIAAIYDKTRYKRMPSSLYAADDYIEKHHIPDDLVSKVYRLVSGQCQVGAQSADKPDDAAVQVTPQQESEQDLATQEATREELRQAEAAATTAGAEPAPLSEGHLKAKRLARIIVSDIALYNQGKVEEGVRNGTFFELLEGDIKEGRALYLQRVSDEIRSTTDYLEEAFRDMISKMMKELNL
jgi:predicted Zn finger-like uncharacterized protein